MRNETIRPRRVHDFVSSILDYDLQGKRVASLAIATVGALQGAQLAVSALGPALGVAKYLDAKHAIKQVDRFLSDTGVDVWRMAAGWVPYVIGQRPEVVAALDWTDFDADDQSTIALHLITRHGRATPLYLDWLLTMIDDRARALMRKFGELLREQATFREISGLT